MSSLLTIVILKSILDGNSLSEFSDASSRIYLSRLLVDKIVSCVFRFTYSRKVHFELWSLWRPFLRFVRPLLFLSYDST
jgi:hypothetical protein